MPCPGETANQVSEIDQAAEVIRQGGVVAFPTETVYGLGANALDATAVARVFELKGRPRFDPLIVHIADFDALDALVTAYSAPARLLAERFWPGPLTLVLPKRSCVPDIVTAGLPSVAVRLPDHPIARDLIRSAGVPLAAPSANLFGRTSPTTAAHVFEQFADRLDMVLDGGACSVGVESTVVSFLDARPLLLRHGGVPLEDLAATIGPIQLPTTESERAVAPGQLPSHYAPRTPLRLFNGQPSFTSGQRVGLLCLRSPRDHAPWTAIEVLSARGDLKEAATRLFAAMRRLDALDLDLILAESVSETGLGRAIMDRLRRASAGE